VHRSFLFLSARRQVRPRSGRSSPHPTWSKTEARTCDKMIPSQKQPRRMVASCPTICKCVAPQHLSDPSHPATWTTGRGRSPAACEAFLTFWHCFWRGTNKRGTASQAGRSRAAAIAPQRLRMSSQWCRRGVGLGSNAYRTATRPKAIRNASYRWQRPSRTPLLASRYSASQPQPLVWPCASAAGTAPSAGRG
jgi:hypothetical protein